MSALQAIALIVVCGLIPELLFKLLPPAPDDLTRLNRLAYEAIVLAVLTLGALLFVIAPRVPDQLRDGVFGGAAGIILGTVIISFALALALLRYIKRRASGSDSAPAGSHFGFGR